MMARREKDAGERFALARSAVGRALPQAAIVLGAVLFPLASVVFILLGQVNADEGWYLYAGQLVCAGRLPYRDFAYTQTPLLPYLYGAAQRPFGPGLYAGRVTSALFSTAAFFLSLPIAHKHGGKTACALAALLGATFTYGLYLQAITKTYALTTFFFMAAFFALTSNMKPGLKAIVATAAVLLATLTRLSALFFALPVIVYALIVARARYKAVVAALCLLAAAWVVLLALPNPDAATWGLLTHHTAQWQDASPAGRAMEILSSRLPWLVAVFPGYFFLAGVLLLFMPYRRIRPYLKRHPALGVVLAGSLLFALPNLVSGGFHAEYFVPAVFVSLPIAGIAYARIFPRQGKYPQMAMNVFLLSALALGIVRGGFNFVELAGGRTPIGEIQAVAAVVAEHSTPQERILAFEALTVVVEAGRLPLPNMTMAQFSLYDGDAATAGRLHLVNGQIARDYIAAGMPKIVLLTTADRVFLRNTSYDEEIVAALQENYRLLYQQEGFGQFDGQIQVYTRKR